MARPLSEYTPFKPVSRKREVAGLISDQFQTTSDQNHHVLRSRNRRKPNEKSHLRLLASGSFTFFSGGAGNRTRVPWHFNVGVYMRSLSISGAYLTAAPCSRSETPTSRIFGRLSVRSLASNATKSKLVTQFLGCPRSGIGVHITHSPSKGATWPRGY